METLNILICGADEVAMQRTARALSGDNVRTETYRPFDLLVARAQGGDFLLIDLDGLNRYFLQSLLPIVRETLPKVPVIGISTKPGYTHLESELKLDACFNKVPHLEDLITLTPRVADKLVCDAGTLREIGGLTTSEEP